MLQKNRQFDYGDNNECGKQAETNGVVCLGPEKLYKKESMDRNGQHVVTMERMKN